MKKVITLVAAILLFMSVSVSFAEILTFTKEYNYQASEFDSKDSSRTIALKQVKRLLLEELGTYLISETEVKNFQMTKEQITVFTAGIVMAEIVDEKWDGKVYWLKAKIAADPEDVTKKVDNLRKDHEKTRELEALKRQADEQSKENEKLRKELAISKGDSAKIAQYKKNLMEIEANELMNEAFTLSNFYNKHKEAIDASTKAIQLYSKPDYKAVAYAGRGTFYILLRDYDQAIKDYTTSIELDGKNARFYSGRGIAYEYLGKFDQSIKDYNKAIEMAPTALDFYGRGRSYSLSNNDKQAVQDFTMAINLNPKYIDAYLMRGYSYGKMRKHEQALMDINNAINLDPKNAEAYYNRGVAYSHLGDFVRAIEDYDKAISLNIKKEDYYCARGVAYGRLGNHHHALVDFNAAIALNPKYSFAYMGRGITYTYLGDFHKAITDFNRAIELNPELYESYSHRGVAYWKLGDHDRAIKDFTAAIKINPKYIEAYKRRSLAYNEIGKNAQAESDLQTIKRLEQQSDKERVDLNLAEMIKEADVLSNKREYAEAIKFYTQAISLSPNNAQLYRNRSVAYMESANFENAINDLNKAISLIPNNADFHVLRGSNYYKLGNRKMAIADLSLAIRLAPDNAYAYVLRGLSRSTDDESGRLADLKKGCELGNNMACDFANKFKKGSTTVKSPTSSSRASKTKKGEILQGDTNIPSKSGDASLFLYTMPDGSVQKVYNTHGIPMAQEDVEKIWKFLKNERQKEALKKQND